ncbi:hypothetical protein [Brachybacterium phenoliresistens]|uniref:Uncharacterized protein n=1 Tax=Brachybacterium phenoliresistens TaxID=396014 RepID=Z9JNV5_9MICO|nr:hypothetical protein [Brachybacterium phenoliresistens]EWS80070.1 hypothetical protein BF93_05090 [Brachybacterium phenoliresistens]
MTTSQGRDSSASPDAPTAAPTPAATAVPAAADGAQIFSVTDNGAWCWFQDERAVVDPAANRALIGTVASRAGADGDSRGGDVDLHVVDLASGAAQTVTLHAGLESDDHDDPALWRRSDGRWLAVYSRHKSDELTRWRISEVDDPTTWGEEHSFDWVGDLFGSQEEARAAGGGRGVTYQNIHQLDGVLYCFVRAINDDPCYLVSHDEGSSWEFGGRLLHREKIGYVNGYARYASGARFGGFGHGTDDRIDVIITEHHPRDFPNSIWHGYLAGGALHRADGTVVSPLGRGLEDETPRAEDLTQVFANGSTWGGSVMTHAWTTDVRRGEDGTLVAILTARADDALGVDTARPAWNTPKEEYAPIDHRFFRGVLRPGAGEWEVRELAGAGPQLMPHEEDYTGLASIDPDDLDALWLSSIVDPRDGTALDRHEIFHGRTADGGETWEWTAITEDSEVENFRPIALPGDPSRQIVTWYRGAMQSSQEYQGEVMLRVAPRR